MSDSPQAMAKLIKALDKISPDMWEDATMHIRVEALIGILVSLVVFIIFLTISKNRWKATEWTKESIIGDQVPDINAKNILTLAAVLLAFTSGATFIGEFAGGVADLVSPGMAAVEELLEVIGEDE